MISLGLLFAFVAGAEALAPQLAEANPVFVLDCGDVPVGVLVQSAGPPTTELMAMGERPAGCLRDSAR